MLEELYKDHWSYKEAPAYRTRYLDCGNIELTVTYKTRWHGVQSATWNCFSHDRIVSMIHYYRNRMKLGRIIAWNMVAQETGLRRDDGEDVLIGEPYHVASSKNWSPEYVLEETER